MELDKELYRKAHQLYREWNEAKLAWRAQNSGNLSPLESWKKYIALWEFCTKLAPSSNENQRRLRMIEWNTYYERMQRIEAWRQKNGKTT